jgi:hypothetical protein
MGIVTDDTSMIVWKRAIDVGLMWRDRGRPYHLTALSPPQPFLITSPSAFNSRGIAPFTLCIIELGDSQSRRRQTEYILMAGVNWETEGVGGWSRGRSLYIHTHKSLLYRFDFNDESVAYYYMDVQNGSNDAQSGETFDFFFVLLFFSRWFISGRFVILDKIIFAKFTQKYLQHIISYDVDKCRVVTSESNWVEFHDSIYFTKKKRKKEIKEVKEKKKIRKRRRNW